MLLLYLLGAAGAGPKHAAQRMVQPRNRVMVASQGLPIKIDHQVQPLGRGSKKQQGQGPGQHVQPDSSRLRLCVLSVMQERQALRKDLKNDGTGLWLRTGTFFRERGIKSSVIVSIRVRVPY